MNSFAAVLKVDHFRNRVMMFERKIQERGGYLFTYISLN